MDIFLKLAITSIIFIPKGVLRKFSIIGKEFNLQGFKDLGKLLNTNNIIRYNGNYFMIHTRFSGSKNKSSRIENDIPIIKEFILNHFGPDAFTKEK